MKKALRELLDRRDLDAIAEQAGRKARILNALVALTFDPDPLIGWRAVEAMGVAAARIAADDPDCVREHLRRLHWLLNDESGGVCWRAPEAMAEIVCRCPDLGAPYARIVVHLLEHLAEEDLVRFRPGVLWAIGRLGPLASEHVGGVIPAIGAALEHPDPQVRGLAAWCLGEVGGPEPLSVRPMLRSDEGPVDLYASGRLESTSVRRLAAQSVGRAADDSA
jgi:hypothetical protein